MHESLPPSNTHSFNKYLLHTYHMPTLVLGAGDLEQRMK